MIKMMLHFLFGCAATACGFCFCAAFFVGLWSTVALLASSGASVLRRDGAWEDVPREDLGVNWTPPLLCLALSAFWGLVALALHAL